MYHTVFTKSTKQTRLIRLMNRMPIEIVSMQCIENVVGVCYEFLINVDNRNFKRLRRRCRNEDIPLWFDGFRRN